jgi:hypothetical protein
MKTYLVFIIQAHNGEQADGTLNDVATLELIDKSLKSSIKRSKKIVDKKFYRLSRVIEKYDENR